MSVLAAVPESQVRKLCSGIPARADSSTRVQRSVAVNSMDATNPPPEHSSPESTHDSAKIFLGFPCDKGGGATVFLACGKVNRVIARRCVDHRRIVRGTMMMTGFTISAVDAFRPPFYPSLLESRPAYGTRQALTVN